MTETVSLPARPLFLEKLSHYHKARLIRCVALTGNIYGLFPSKQEEGVNFLPLEAILERALANARLLKQDIELKFITIVLKSNGIHLVNSDDKNELSVAYGEISSLLEKKEVSPLRAMQCFGELLRSAAMIRRDLDNAKSDRDMRPICIIVDQANFILPNLDISRMTAQDRDVWRYFSDLLRDETIWPDNQTADKRQDLVILLSPTASELNERIFALPKTECIEIPIPDVSDCVMFVRERVRQFPRLGELIYPDEEKPLERFARDARGLDLRALDDMLTVALRQDLSLDRKTVQREKAEILNSEYGEVMEIEEADFGPEDIGDLEHVKRYFDEVLEAIQAGDSDLVPVGFDLVGPPGTGKSAICRAYAKRAGYNFIKPKNFRTMFLGETERKMEKFIFGARALAPVFIVNDEADLAEAGRDDPKGDSGVSDRLMKRWMEFRSDPSIRGQVVVISCSNRPDRIDPALKRAGRSDDKLLLPSPSKEGRVEILRVLFRRSKTPHILSDADFVQCAEMTEELSGAEIEKIVRDSRRFALKEGKKDVEPEHVKKAIEDFIPPANQRERDTMTLMGLLECSSRRFLPENAKEIVQKIKEQDLVYGLEEILEEIKARNIITL